MKEKTNIILKIILISIISLLTIFLAAKSNTEAGKMDEFTDGDELGKYIYDAVQRDGGSDFVDIPRDELFNKELKLISKSHSGKNWGLKYPSSACLYHNTRNVGGSWSYIVIKNIIEMGVDEEGNYYATSYWDRGSNSTGSWNSGSSTITGENALRLAAAIKYSVKHGYVELDGENLNIYWTGSHQYRAAVYKYLYQALDSGLQVSPWFNNTWVTRTYRPWMGDGTGTDAVRLVESETNNCRGFSKIKKPENPPKVEIKSSSSSETILGPFKVVYGGKGVKSIEIQDAENSNAAIAGLRFEYSKNVNGPWGTSANSITNIPNNTNFYIKVIGNISTYKKINVKFIQEKATFLKARIAMGKNQGVADGYISQNICYYGFSESSEGGSVTFGNIIINPGIIKLEKLDRQTHNPVNIEFKIQTRRKGQTTTTNWLKDNGNGTYKYNATANEATTFKTVQGIKQLEHLSITECEYRIIETKILVSGYRLEDQQGYNETTKVVELTNWFDLNNIANFTYNAEKYQDRRVNIKGYVWNEGKGKGKEFDSIYTTDGTGYEKDLRLKGVEVKLINKSTGEVIATTTTDSKGEYVFNEKILYKDLNKHYINFDYSGLTIKYFNGENEIGRSGKEYIPVKYNDKSLDKIVTNGSRAMMQTIKQKDTDLVDPETGNGGVAKTYSGTNATLLKTYGLKALAEDGKLYNDSNYTLHDINLGIKPIYIPDYLIREDLYYVKITMNDYEYAYKYGKDQLKLPTAPKIDSTEYNRPIYPSAIYDLKSGNNPDGQIKVYAVYIIRIENTTTHDEEELYREQKLKITSLTNEFDKNKYVLDKTISKTENKSDIEENLKATVEPDILNWSETTKGAKYDLSKKPIEIAAGGYVNKYIELRVQDEEVKRILEAPGNTVTETTVVKSNGYHDYKRKDYSWANTTASTNSKVQDHNTIDAEREDRAPNLRLKLGKEREITGVVFNDNIDMSGRQEGEVLGNGQHEAAENLVKDAKVEIVRGDDFENGTPAKVYIGSNDKKSYTIEDAVTYSNAKGIFSIKGLMPGKYFLRITYGIYGDESKKHTKLYTADGKEIGNVLVNDYKSTIVTSKVAKNALGYNNNKYKDEWYKYLEKDNYSVAVDSLTTRARCAEENPPENISAGTAKMDITIESTKDDFTLSGDGMQAEKFGGINFGIIQQAKQKVEIGKKITNVRLVNEPNKIFDGNPQDDNGNLPGVVDLDGDDSNHGSTHTKIETISDNLQGSDFSVKYEITVKNTSDLNYYETDSRYSGWYYKFGEITRYSEKIRIDVRDVIDCYDPVMEYSSGEKIGEKIIKSVDVRRSGDGKAIGGNKYESSSINEQESKVKENYEKTYKYEKVLSITRWSLLQRNYTDKVSFEFKKTLSKEENNIHYINGSGVAEAHNSVAEEHLGNGIAQFTLKFARPVELPPPSFADIVISEPTGSNKYLITNIYIISGIVALSLAATGIVIFMRKKK